MIAVTGATGGLGGRVARRLAERGTPQRLVVRDPSRAPDLPSAEIKGPAVYADGDSIRAALGGVETLYFVPATEDLDRLDQHRTAIKAAADVGVERIVYVSFQGAAADATFTFARDHFHTEELIRATGIPFTFLRSSIYLDFIPQMVGDDGVIKGPAGDGRVAPVARDDLADAAVAVLTSPADAHAGRTYDLTGPEALTMAEIAGRLRATFHNETLDEAWAARRPTGAPDWMIEGWITTYLAIANGELARVTDHVERLTGHPPRGLRTVREHH
jgi:NAD(P)H dehydrogenase (quinone)